MAGRDATTGGPAPRSGRIAPLGLGWPNLVSGFRVLLVPVLVALVLVDTRTASYVAAGVFVLGGLTDGLDGYLARRFGTTTRTGQWLDPLSDKLLVAAPILALLGVGRFPAVAAIVIVAREVLVTLLRVYLGTRRASMPASSIAKVKTATQLLAVFLYLLPLSHAWHAAKLAVLSVAVVATVYTGLDYFVRLPGRSRTR